MTQLHCYIPDNIAQQAQYRAKQMGLSLPRYLAELIKRDVTTNTTWSEAYFDNLGKWEGEQLERPKQLPLENRLQLCDFLNELPQLPENEGLSRDEIQQYIREERKSWDK